jgi:hypothetical protein
MSALQRSQRIDLSFLSNRHSRWLDLLVDDCLIVELKAVEKVLPMGRTKTIRPNSFPRHLTSRRKKLIRPPRYQ